MRLPIPKGRKAIFVLAIPLALAGAGGFAFMQLSAAPSAPPAIPDPAAGQLGPMLALDSRVVNLSPGKTLSYKYAKVAVTIEMRPAAASFYDLHGEVRTKEEKTELAKYDEAIPLLFDALGSVVASHTPDSLVTPEGRSVLKTELLAAMRKVLGDTEVIDIFLTDFVMQ
jgi:flagellar basal body-associated protein FliL